MALKYICDRLQDYNINFFVNELVEASKNLGILQAKIDAYKFNSILIPMLHRKEVISSMDTKPSQVKHIFGNRPGHLPDTPANRKLLTDTANTPKYYKGTDKYSNSWHIQTDNKGRQVWTRSQNGKINEGGRNNVPRPWDKETGLYNNPLKRKKKGR